MSDIQYDQFLSRIYEDAPYFGQPRARSLDTFNGFYFKRLGEPPRRVLELGSATGMLTVPLARRGFEVDSVDISAAMHEILAEKLRAEEPSVAQRVRQIVGDAITYSGEERYETIVMPEGVVISIPDREAQLALLDNCYRNLASGGRLYADFVQPRWKLIYEQTLQEHTRFVSRTGEQYLLSLTFRNNRHTQVEDWRLVFTHENGARKSERIEVNVQFRFLSHSEVTLMLERAGFKVVDIDVNHAGGRGFAVIAEKN